MILFQINFGNQGPNLYLHEIHIVGFTSMIIFFKILQFCFQLVYQTVFLLDECSGFVNLPHQLHYKINVAFILKIYLYICFSPLFNGMAACIQVSLASIFYAFPVIVFPHIFLGLNYIRLLPINYLVLLIGDIFKMYNGIL